MLFLRYVCLRNLHIVSADHYFLTFAVNENRICFMASLFPYQNDNIIIFDIAFVFSINAEFLPAFFVLQCDETFSSIVWIAVYNASLKLDNKDIACPIIFCLVFYSEIISVKRVTEKKTKHIAFSIYSTLIKI